ncbi:MAG: Crp/Fnr family transcriptional regulator [Pseudomonadota bacterium]
MVSSFNSYPTGLMDGLGASARDALVAAGTRIRLSNGQFLQSRGADKAGMVVVLSGHVRMMTIARDGSALLLAILGPGQQFNEVTLFAGAAQTHDASAVGDTELLVLTESDYERVAGAHPEIVQALLRSNVHRLHQLVELLNDLRALPKPVVLARLLLKNARHVTRGGAAGPVEIDISQEDVAMFLGVSRAYLNKTLGQLADLGLVDVSYRRIHVPDIGALEDWVQENLAYESVESPAPDACSDTPGGTTHGRRDRAVPER